MRHSFQTAAALLAALLVAACSPHEFPESGSGYPERDFSLKITFEDDLPDYRHLRPDTKAEDVARLRYTVLFWRYLSENAFGLDPDYSFSFERSSIAELDTVIYLPIDPAKYRVAGWVDWVGGDAGVGYDVSNPEEIRLPASYDAGEHARDAFTVVTDFNVDGFRRAGMTYEKTVVLKRPVAQLRIVSPEALTFIAQTGLDPSQMRATLRYASPIPDGYNILLGTTLGARKDVTLTGTPRYDSSGELVFLSDFIFLMDDATVSVEFTLTDLSGKEIIVWSGELPLRNSHATTLSFDMPYGGDDKPGGIGISPGFDDEIEVPID
jgi:hypothetical protein